MRRSEADDTLGSRVAYRGGPPRRRPPGAPARPRIPLSRAPREVLLDGGGPCRLARDGALHPAADLCGPAGTRRIGGGGGGALASRPGARARSGHVQTHDDPFATRSVRARPPAVRSLGTDPHEGRIERSTGGPPVPRQRSDPRPSDAGRIPPRSARSSREVGRPELPRRVRLPNRMRLVRDGAVALHAVRGNTARKRFRQAARSVTSPLRVDPLPPATRQIGVLRSKTHRTRRGLRTLATSLRRSVRTRPALRV